MMTMTPLLVPALGPLPCQHCKAIVIVYRVCYSEIRLPILVVHDAGAASVHRCERP